MATQYSTNYTIPYPDSSDKVNEGYLRIQELVNKIDITRVHTTLEADTFFPAIDTTKWELVFEEFHPKDEKHDYDFTFLTYLKK